MTFHEAIRDARIKARLTQREAADQTGCDHTYLSKLESGKMPAPSVDLILRLATLYRADSHILLEYAGKTLCRCSSEIAQMRERIECLEAAILGMGGRLYEKR